MNQLTLALAAAGVLVIAVGAFVAYRKFFAAPPPPPPKPAVTAKPAAPVRKVEAPAPVPAGPSKLAALVAATNTAKAKVPPAVQAPPAHVESTAPAEPAPAVPAMVPAVTEVAPPPQAPPAPTRPSLQVRAFVDRLKIGGFRIGPPARVFIGGVTYKEGDVIDEDLGIVFVGVDPAAEVLLFKDSNGFVLRRRL